MDDVDWPAYLQRFHAEHPGITENVLDHADADGLKPYRWLADAVAGRGRVLDLACGSGPLVPALRAQGWVGVDRSTPEVRLAAGRGEAPVARADATALPLDEASFGAVVCSMALMLVEPLDSVLAEVSRVLHPGGVFAALLPSNRPLTPADAARYSRLLAVLRRSSFRYPNDRHLDAVGPVLARSGLRLVSDERRRFSCHVTTPIMGVMCVRSLYLPGLPADRLAAGEKLAARWVGSRLGLPLRLVVATRPG